MKPATESRPPRIYIQMTRDECIDLFDGNMSELARALKISRQAVHKRRSNDYVPIWWTERLAEFFR
jgi:DNA-binding XRE family transcriptional regulator